MKVSHEKLNHALCIFKEEVNLNLPQMTQLEKNNFITEVAENLEGMIRMNRVMQEVARQIKQEQ